MENSSSLSVTRPSVSQTDISRTNISSHDGIIEGSNITYPYDFQMERTVFDSCILAAIITGNLVVLFAVWIRKKRSRMTFFIFQLAIADLLVGLCSVTPDLVLMVEGKWGGGDPICKIVKYIQGVVTYGSTYVLVALSIDRFDAIARPLGGISNPLLRCKILTACAWAVGAVFSLPMFMFRDIEGQCVIDFFSVTDWQIYLTLIAIAVFFIPTIIITFCYGAIIFVIWRANNNLFTKQEANEELYPKNGFKTHKSPRPLRKGRRREASKSCRGIIPQAKVRTIKMTVVIVIAFILCWSPYFIVNILAVYSHFDFSNPLLVGVYGFIQSLAPLNSAANPLIYGIFSARTCQELRRTNIIEQVLGKCECCRSRLQRYRTARQTDYVCVSYTEVTYSCKQTGIPPDKSLDIIKPSDSSELCDLVINCDKNGIPSRC